MTRPPKVNSDGQKSLIEAQAKFDNFQEQIKDFNPCEAGGKVEETEPQTKLSTKEIKKIDAEYIKPIRTIARTNFKSDKTDSRTYWDEKNRTQRDEDWEYVKCIVENNEVIGEAVEIWTAKWGCDPAHFWRVPCNKPVMIPKHLAEQLSKCRYHRLRMDENRVVGHNHAGQMTGAIVADTVTNRINARPVGFGF